MSEAGRLRCPASCMDIVFQLVLLLAGLALAILASDVAVAAAMLLVTRLLPPTKPEAPPPVRVNGRLPQVGVIVAALAVVGPALRWRYGHW